MKGSASVSDEEEGVAFIAPEGMRDLRQANRRRAAVDETGCCTKVLGTDWCGSLLSILVIILVPLVVYQTRPLSGVPSLPALRAEKTQLEVELARERARASPPPPASALSAHGAGAAIAPPYVVASPPQLSLPPTERPAPGPSAAGMCYGHTNSTLCPDGWKVLALPHDGFVGDTCRQKEGQVWGYRCPSDCYRGMPFYCRSLPAS